jgi:hypothetical protein
MHDLESKLSDYWEDVIASSQPIDVDAVLAGQRGVVPDDEIVLNELLEAESRSGADAAIAVPFDSSATVDTAAPAADSADAETCEQCGADLPVFDLREPGESPEPPPRKHRAAVFAVAAAILLLVGVVVVPDRNDGNVQTEPVSSATTPEPVPSPTPPDPTPPRQEVGPPPSVVDSLGYRWSRVLDDEAVFGGVGEARMLSVTVGGPGLVAVGKSGLNAVVWTSVDGIAWSRVAHDEAVFGGAIMRGVTVGGPGLVAVGTVSGSIDGWGADAAVWTSVDGITWSRVAHDEAVFGGAIMRGVTVGGPGLVAVGSVLIDGWDDQLERYRKWPGDAAVWTSVDGITWSRVPHDEAVFGGANNQGMIDVTVGGPGLVAVGSDGLGFNDDSPSQVAAVWISVDGITWSRLPKNAVPGGQNYLMWSVTAGGPGLVAVGWDHPELVRANTSDAAVWTSVDGTTWSRVPHDEAIFGATGGWEMVSVSAAGPGLVAVGDAVWTSVDGRTWSLSEQLGPDFGEETMWSLTAGGPGLVAVGDSGDEAAVWTSVDGITWSRVTDDEAVVGEDK